MITRDDCEIISGPYYSNCILEALKVKIKNIKIKVYPCLPYFDELGHLRSSHVVWEDDSYSYDFSDEAWDDTGSFWQYFWYKGYIRRWPKDFAKNFSMRRNKIAMKSWRRKLHVYTK